MTAQSNRPSGARGHRDRERDAGDRQPIAVRLLEEEAEIGHEGRAAGRPSRSRSRPTPSAKRRGNSPCWSPIARSARASPAFSRERAPARAAPRARRPRRRRPGASSASRQPTWCAIVGIVIARDEAADRHAHLLDAHEQAAVARGRRAAHDHVRRRRDQPVGEAHRADADAGRTRRPGRAPRARSRSRPRRPRPRASAARRSGPSAGPTAPR